MATGDCYSANGRLMFGKDNSYRLCHGVGLLQTDDKPFGHCWVEKGNRCIDKSNGNDINFPKKLYYTLLRAPVPGYKIYKYKPIEVSKNVVKYNHWGPWDLKPPR
tara:strand:+ start:277 stop:591 length:315 start_codon:yes stop_codon:yes gene_type:complete